VARSQMAQETAVASSPAPVISATAASDGTVNLSIQYADSQSRQTNLLNFSV